MAKRREILVIEDDAGVRTVLEVALETAGYAVRTAATGDGGWREVQAAPPDLVLLDLMLPGLGGLEICRRMRRDAALRDVPVVMLTALGDEDRVVEGLDAGADDYVTKPFSPTVLLARLRAALRRPVAAEQETPAFDGLVLEPDRRTVQVNGVPTPQLSANEFAALELFLKRPGRVFTRMMLLDAVQGPEKCVTERAVDVMIVGLRRKLGDWSSHLETVRGVGYRLAKANPPQEQELQRAP